MRKFPRFRRGNTAVLAMLFLILFSTLALGFYAAVTTAVQVAGNEQRSSRALLAAESGMQFMKLQLASLNVPPTTPTEDLFEEVFDQLSAQLNGYPNMPSGTTVEMNADGDKIYIPSSDNTYINVDGSGMKFRITIEKQQNGQQLRVITSGHYGSNTSTRGVKLDYSIAQNASSIFNYGVASKSAISMTGNVSITGTTGNPGMGSVLSATLSTPVGLTMTGNAEISGDVSFVHPSAAPSVGSNATIAGYKPSQAGFADHVHTDVPAPEFPYIDTSAFEPFVPGPSATGSQVITSSNPSGTSFKNIRIKAGANPTFNGGSTLQGVIFVESPNQVRFNGGATIQGVVVVETDGNNNESLDPDANVINFLGGVTALGVQTLPATSDFPAALRALTGSMLLAPGFTAKFGGNFGTVSGSIIASKLEFSGTAGGTVKGTVINIEDTALTLAGTSDIVIESQGTANYPAGVFFGSHYAPLPHTYDEVRP